MDKKKLTKLNYNENLDLDVIDKSDLEINTKPKPKIDPDIL